MLNGWFRLNTVAALALAIYAIAASASLAQQWPTRPVRLVLPFGPGSGADTAARLITDKLQQKWDQPVIIDGKPGGDGLLSLQTVVSANDDHTLFFGPSSIFVVQRYMHENISFDPETDLAPIAGVAKVQIAVAVPTKFRHRHARRIRGAGARQAERDELCGRAWLFRIRIRRICQRKRTRDRKGSLPRHHQVADRSRRKQNPVVHAILRRYANLRSDRQDQDHCN